MKNWYYNYQTTKSNLLIHCPRDPRFNPRLRRWFELLLRQENLFWTHHSLKYKPSVQKPECKPFMWIKVQVPVLWDVGFSIKVVESRSNWLLQGEHSLLCYHAEVSLQKRRRNTIFRDVIWINFDQFNKLTN